MDKPRSSPWFEAVADQRRWPALDAPVDTDVVVVGGGMVGVITAWQCAQLGKRVVLLEKDHVATGDTGFTTAFLTRIPDVDSLADLAKLRGQDYLQQVFRAARKGQEYLYDLIARENIACDLHRSAAYYGTFTADDPALARDWEVVRTKDPQATLVDATQDPAAQPFVRAIRFADEGRFHIRKFILGLLEKAVQRNVAVYEETAVRTVEERGGRSVVQTEKGTITTQYVVFATGAPHQVFADLQQYVTPTMTYVVNARFTGAAPIADCTYWDTGHPYQYFRPYDDHTIMLGGADVRAGERQPITPYEKLRGYLRARWHEPFEITHQWSGTLYETEDQLPIITAHPTRKNVFLATGFAGNGMVMGTMAALLLADFCAGKQPKAARLFSLERLRNSKTEGSKKKGTLLPALRVLFPLIALFLVAFPIMTYFRVRGFAVFQGLAFNDSATILFPLAGLLAFSLLWIQFLIGSSMPLLRKVYPKIVIFHRTEGVFVLLFALVHPLLLLLGVGWTTYWAKTYVPEHLLPYVWVGYVQLMLLIITAGTALLARIPLVRRYWHTVHYLNYVVFALVWIHSWFLGTDVRGTGLRWLWIVMAAVAVLSIAGRIARALPKKQARQSATAQPSIPPEGFIAVAKESDLTNEKPFCATLGEKKIVLARVRGTVFALNNVCTHAGGPLCEGTLQDGVIECPWHASRFRMEDGGVVQGPARQPQPRYAVRVQNGEIFVRVEQAT